jgi:hypothetical protein
MATDDETDPDVSDLARQVIAELDPGTVIDSKVILSRRQVIGLSTGALSLGALAGFGAGEAEAQSAGAVGTDADPVDVQGFSVTAANELIDPSGTSHTGELADAADTTSTNVSGGFELTVDGDTYEFNQ